MAARLVAPAGRVVGIELIPELAAQSRDDLAAAGVTNVEIVTGDGTRGSPAGAPYDRAIITAATWDVPTVLLDQVAEGGCALVPIELRSADGCDVTLLRREHDALVAEHAVPGWFVPLLGEGQDRGARRHPPAGDAGERFALPLGTTEAGGSAPAAATFRAFLGRTEPGFVAAPSPSDWRLDRPLTPFGLDDAATGSVALWQGGEIIAYGGRAAAIRLAQAYARWAALGLPGTGAFRVEVHRAGSAPSEDDRLWLEKRGGTVLAWRLRPEIGDWQTLAAAKPPS